VEFVIFIRPAEVTLPFCIPSGTSSVHPFDRIGTKNRSSCGRGQHVICVSLCKSERLLLEECSFSNSSSVVRTCLHGCARSMQSESHRLLICI